jgi:glycosyltransferase involved in cell wall biosynthesis
MQIQYKAPHSHGILPQIQSLKAVNGMRRQVLTHPGEARVSAVIITFNEESIIGTTLNMLWWCDEIVIIDSGSTDNTLEICRQYGCRVFGRSFNGFGEQKKYGVSRAKNDWILCLDADEVLTEELVAEIREEMRQTSGKFSAYSIPRNLVFMNRVFSYGKETNAGILRLFNRQKGNWDGAVVHERVCVDGAIKNLHHKILHYSYKDYNHFINKINLYSSLGARKSFFQNKRKGKMVTIASIPFNFLKYYILDRNFMNGYRGFAWSFLNTVYHFLKYLKLEELRRKEKAGQN